MRVASHLLFLLGMSLCAFAFAQPSQEERTKLWSALHRALPGKNISAIDLYCENPSLTEVLFRSNGQTWLFSSSSDELSLVQHAKAIPSGVNAITFERSPAHLGRGFFVLWHSGMDVLHIGSKE